jgi:biopolymer transport protein ExbD
MKFLYIALLSVFFLSCQKTEVKVPVNDNPGLNEIWDNSRIYILINEEGGEQNPELKLGQVITTTHWLVAVDKRLSMKKLVKPIEKILKKRHKKSVHTKEGAHAYFSYLDSVKKKMAFIDFDSIQLMSDIYTSKKYFEKYSKADINMQKFHITILQDDIVLNDSIHFDSSLSKQQLTDSLWEIMSKKTNEKQNRLYLNFDENMNFDRFLNYYTFFKNNPMPKGKLSNKIFIFKP